MVVSLPRAWRNFSSGCATFQAMSGLTWCFLPSGDKSTGFSQRGSLFWDLQPHTWPEFPTPHKASNPAQVIVIQATGWVGGSLLLEYQPWVFNSQGAALPYGLVSQGAGSRVPDFSSLVGGNHSGHTDWTSGTQLCVGPSTPWTEVISIIILKAGSLKWYKFQTSKHTHHAHLAVHACDPRRKSSRPAWDT